ncbi:MAG: 4-(cytidine 5'-diphospho)-2-C-methyl-D-erythritol kinase [Pseudobdellovibrionaceae bacterium]
MKPLKIFAPAKINYNLKIIRKREDGFHDLSSDVGFLNIGDWLQFSQAKSFQYSVGGEFASHCPINQNDDLVVKAAKLFFQASGAPPKISIQLKKNLPAGAGLGGGSADAAGVLRGLNTFFEINWPLDRLTALALNLGSDTGVCVESKPVHMEGRGDIIKPLEKVPFDGHFLVVWPDVHSSTKIVYGARPDKITQKPILENDLARTAMKLYPAIRTCLGLLAESDGSMNTRLSGSGSACYAVFADREKASTAAAHIAKRHPTWWVKLAHSYKSA